MASTERLQVVIDAQNNTRQAFSGARQQIAKTQQKMRQVGRKMQRVGTQMTQFVSLPLAAAGVAAKKFASDFNQNLKQTQVQAALTNEEISKIEPAVEKIATTTGKSMDEIFNSMTLAQSSTLDLKEANELVATAAEASASGFGKMRNLVNLATTANNKFGEEIDSASEGLNTLVGAADQVMAQMDRFVPAFLKGTGGMQQLNVSMDEGAAVFARLADAARNTRVAGTQFRALMTKLAKPTKDMRALLNDTFGSLQDFRKAMGDDAVGSLFKLRDAMEESSKTTATLLGNVRAVSGASNLFASSMEDVNKVLKATSREDLIAEKFRKSANFARLLKRAVNALKVALQPVGDALIKHLSGPLSTFITKAREFAAWFENLPSKVKQTIIVLGTVLAALGPVVAILGTFSLLLGSIGTTSLIVAGALSGLAAAGAWMATQWDKVKSVAQGVWQQLKQWGVIKSIRRNVKLLVKNFRQNLLPTLRRFWQRHGKNFKLIAKSIAVVLGGTLFFAIQGIITLLNGLITIVDAVVSAWMKLTKFNKETLIPALKNLGGWIRDGVVSAISAMVSGVKTAVDWFGDLIQKIESFLDLSGKLPDWAVEDVGGALPDFFDVSGSFDSGGVVPGPVGKPRLAKVHAGETILPTHKQGFAGAGGGNVNITINGDVSGREVIEKVKQGLMSDLGRETKVSLQ